jgi:Flp pilus assembly protein TadG
MITRRRHERGQAILEFAILTPLVLILMFIIVDFGIGLAYRVILTNAAREGARYGAVGAPTYDACSQPTVLERIRCKTSAQSRNLVDDADTQIQVAFLDSNSNGDLEPGDTVAVRIDYDYEPITALGLDTTLGWLGFPGITSISMDSCTDMRVEQVDRTASISGVNPCD